MAMPNAERTKEKATKTVDPLQSAVELYGRYVELAQLSTVGAPPVDSPDSEYRRSWDHPLGMVLTSGR